MFDALMRRRGGPGGNEPSGKRQKRSDVLEALGGDLGGFGGPKNSGFGLSRGATPSSTSAVAKAEADKAAMAAWLAEEDASAKEESKQNDDTKKGDDDDGDDMEEVTPDVSVPDADGGATAEDEPVVADAPPEPAIEEQSGPAKIVGDEAPSSGWRSKFGEAKDSWSIQGDTLRCLFWHSGTGCCFEWDQEQGTLLQFVEKASAGPTDEPQKMPIWSSACPDRHSWIWEQLPLPPTDLAASPKATADAAATPSSDAGLAPPGDDEVLDDNIWEKRCQAKEKSKDIADVTGPAQEAPQQKQDLDAMAMPPPSFSPRKAAATAAALSSTSPSPSSSPSSSTSAAGVAAAPTASSSSSPSSPSSPSSSDAMSMPPPSFNPRATTSSSSSSSPSSSMPPPSFTPRSASALLSSSSSSTSSSSSSSSSAASASAAAASSSSSSAGAASGGGSSSSSSKAAGAARGAKTKDLFAIPGLEGESLEAEEDLQPSSMPVDLSAVGAPKASPLQRLDDDEDEDDFLGLAGPSLADGDEEVALPAAPIEKVKPQALDVELDMFGNPEE